MIPQSVIDQATEQAELERGFVTIESYMRAVDKYADLVQAITDPENQPSQYGTVTLDFMREKIADLEKDAARYRWLREKSEDEMGLLLKSIVMTMNDVIDGAILRNNA